MNTTDRPKIFYGYIIVGACFILLFHLWGIALNTMPIFLKPITTDMGWSRGALSIAGAFGGLGTLLTAPLAGKALDRFGARPIVLGGSTLIGIGFLVYSQVTFLWQLYLINIVIGTGIMFSTVIPCSALISNWFVSRRGTAMGVAFSGTAVGGLVMTPIAEWMIRSYGWQTTLGINGAYILLVSLPTAFFLIRNHPSDMGLKPYLSPGEDAGAAESEWGVTVKEAVSFPVFWQIALIAALVSLVTGGFGFHCVAYLSDIGHSPVRAAYAWSVVMGAMLLGKFAVGPISDRIGSNYTMGGCSLILAAALYLVLYADTYAIVLVFACIYGFALGAPMALNPLLTSDNLGMKHYGAIYGLLTVAGLIGGVAGPVISGKVFDLQNTYLPVFYGFIAIMIVTAAICLRVKRAPQTEISQSRENTVSKAVPE
ncbi:MAG: MFS transporter [Proteobacteria bacterium]|nr:MFS transporter [Pseudomonadota bacterium]